MKYAKELSSVALNGVISGKKNTVCLRIKLLPFLEKC